MLTFSQAILAARLPWVGREATRQRLIRANRLGLVARHSTKEGRPIFAARDLVVFRAIEAIRGERGDLEILEAVSTALYARTAPDGSNGIAAPVYWAAREIHAGRLPVLTLARISRNAAAPEWSGLVHPVTTICEFQDGDEPIALLQVPLLPVFEPLLAHFE